MVRSVEDNLIVAGDNLMVVEDNLMMVGDKMMAVGDKLMAVGDKLTVVGISLEDKLKGEQEDMVMVDMYLNLAGMKDREMELGRL